eukprot:COSAG01_NODE_808_length_13418_cov_9.469631_4_plen_167_part_00
MHSEENTCTCYVSLGAASTPSGWCSQPVCNRPPTASPRRSAHAERPLKLSFWSEIKIACPLLSADVFDNNGSLAGGDVFVVWLCRRSAMSCGRACGRARVDDRAASFFRIMQATQQEQQSMGSFHGACLHAYKSCSTDAAIVCVQLGRALPILARCAEPLLACVPS